MTTNNSYWDNIIHMNDEQGVLCNSHIGNIKNFDVEKVNCNKCKKFMKNPKQLNISRKIRKEKEEIKNNEQTI
jgi:hypothetical protein